MIVATANLIGGWMVVVVGGRRCRIVRVLLLLLLLLVRQVIHHTVPYFGFFLGHFHQTGHQFGLGSRRMTSVMMMMMI